MATFGSIDRKLPLLTWVIQADPDIRAEVQAVADRAIPREGFWPTQPDEFEAKYLEEEVAPLCRFTADLAEALYEDDIRRYHLDTLSTLLRTRDVWFYDGVGAPEGNMRRVYYCPSYEWFSNNEYEGSEEGSRHVPLNQVLRQYSSTFGAVEQILVHIDRLFRQVLRGDSPLRRCSECNYLFIATRSDHLQFCSQRCSDRAGKRRRRAAEKNFRPSI